ncbi:hypothetical protein JHT19_08060 [Vibrio parahaemolyticus]|uniref:Uncharacterized protein n=1 Tax=Vibrio parahaemolyticus TaxID=670 RepID=A0A7Z2MS40_VIBPH|nr:DUF5677 domain-containing protein [Vibrio parahaemolyticus]MCR9723600.1 DUF5677 domain-containing protein [Vibrio parahaemolyticus]MCR9745430.1 DUF5677 domain-containing protein [Vibrio parahaemolyticus]QHH09409.1 hypothetical protein EHC69_08460 [Vibrio parahaemolyticus]UJX10000.1 hypothetical protein JHT19_08060 [Vibrio parahaemolyticus]HAS6672285.1 hypothetical protein [Vibrio parahaemolyticus]
MTVGYKFGDIQHRIDKLGEGFDDISNEKLVEISKSFAKPMLKSHLKSSPQNYKVTLQKRREFESVNVEKWEQAFSLFDSFIQLAFEVVSEYRKYNEALAEKAEDHQFIALIQLHAKAILVAREVQALVSAGFADGALARWRTAHELAVCASVISLSKESGLRFLLSEHVKNAKGMRCYEHYHKRLNHAPFNKERWEANLLQESEALAILGKDYARKGDYEWARPLATDNGIRINERITLKTLEEIVGLDHYRPYFSWACEKNHAPSKVNYANLGTSFNEQNPLFLVGASSFGHLEPINCTSLSLFFTTIACLVPYPNIDTIAFNHVLADFVKQVSQACIESQ